MMQDGTVRQTDVALVNDAEAWNGSWGSLKMNQRPKWYGRKMPPSTPWLTRAGSWYTYATGTMRPMYDLADDVREFADARNRRKWALAYVAFLCLLMAGATWAIWSGH